MTTMTIAAILSRGRRLRGAGGRVLAWARPRAPGAPGPCAGTGPVGGPEGTGPDEESVPDAWLAREDKMTCGASLRAQSLWSRPAWPDPADFRRSSFPGQALVPP